MANNHIILNNKELLIKHFGSRRAQELYNKALYAAVGRCPFCTEPVGEFKDELSLQEFKVTGLCQSCQDGFYEEEEL